MVGVLGKMSKMEVSPSEEGKEGWTGNFGGCFVCVLYGLNCRQTTVSCLELCLEQGGEWGCWRESS